MDLKRLRTFIRVAEDGSLSKASDRLRLAQPALSRHIKLLEAEIGHELFVRDGRGMQLTEAGRELLLRIGGLVQQIEKSIDDVRALSSAPQGHVALGMMPSVSYILASRIARRVANEAPDISLRIVEGYAGHLIDWLHRGEIDATLLYGPGSDLHLRVTDLLLEELVLVGPSSADLDAKTPVPVSTLGKVKLVLPSKPHGLRTVVESAAARARTTLRVQFEADSFRVLKDLVEEGLGYSVLPISAIYREQRQGKFKYAHLVKPKVVRHIILALPPNRADTRATSAVVALLLDEISNLIKSGVWQAYSLPDMKDRMLAE